MPLIEVGCLDLIGKSVGVPVCDLIGGRVRDKVPFSAYPFYKHAGGGGEGEDARPDKYGECLTPETLVGQVLKMREEYGFGSIKFKAGVLPPEEEIETVKGTVPRTWAGGSLAHRSELRLDGGYLGSRGPGIGRGIGKGRVFGGPDGQH